MDTARSRSTTCRQTTSLLMASATAPAKACSRSSTRRSTTDVAPPTGFVFSSSTAPPSPPHRTPPRATTMERACHQTALQRTATRRLRPRGWLLINMQQLREMGRSRPKLFTSRKAPRHLRWRPKVKQLALTILARPRPPCRRPRRTLCHGVRGLSMSLLTPRRGIPPPILTPRTRHRWDQVVQKRQTQARRL